MEDIYTLTCKACGNAYYSPESFPKHQYCKACMTSVIVKEKALNRHQIGETWTLDETDIEIIGRN